MACRRSIEGSGTVRYLLGRPQDMFALSLILRIGAHAMVSNNS